MSGRYDDPDPRGRRGTRPPARPGPAPAPQDQDEYYEPGWRGGTGSGGTGSGGTGPGGRQPGRPGFQTPQPPYRPQPGRPGPPPGYGGTDPRRPAPGYGGTGPQPRPMPNPGRPDARRQPDPRGYPDPRYGAKGLHDEEEHESGFFAYDDNDDDRDFDRPRKRRRSRWIAPLVAVLVILLPLSGLVYYGYGYYMGKYHPKDYSGAGYGDVTVHVPAGATATSLGPELTSLGVVASSRAFVLAAEHYSGTGTLESGYFKLHLHMQASQAYTVLLNPANMVQTIVRFPEGLRVATIVSLLGQHTALSLSSYQAALADTAALGLPSYAKGKAEGFLFPATYQVTPNETALDVLKAMVARYNQEAQALNLSSEATKVQLSPDQVIIVASLVQAEGGKLSDYPKIARVVYNRLKDGMKLQFDSTVLYGLGKFGTTVTQAQIDANTPYNSYLHTGLPPTPIDNPGQSAIEAALHPATGDYLYFLTLKNGTTEFSANPITG